MTEPIKCSTCVRFEGLLDKWEAEGLTDDEVQFVLDHQDDCPMGLHSIEAIEQDCGLPTGSLQNLRGRNPLPKPDPSTVEARTRALEMILSPQQGETARDTEEMHREFWARISGQTYAVAQIAEAGMIHIVGLAASEFGRRSFKAAETHSNTLVSLCAGGRITEVPLAAFEPIAPTATEGSDVVHMTATTKERPRETRPLGRKDRILFRRAAVGSFVVEAFGDDNDDLYIRILEAKQRSSA